MGQLVNLKSVLNVVKIEGEVKTNFKIVSSFLSLDPKLSDLVMNKSKIL
jgi:hypothetical protein